MDIGTQQYDFDHEAFALLIDEAEVWWRENDTRFYETLNPGVSESE